MMKWPFIPAEKLYSNVTDGTHDSPKAQSKGFPLVTSKNIKGGVLDLSTASLISKEDYESINKRSQVEKWDVIISMIGEYCGYTYIEKNDNIIYAIKNVGLFKTKSKIEANWLTYYLQSDYGRHYLGQAKSGSSQPYLSLGALRQLPILNPEQIEKEKIAKVLSDLDAKIELNNRINAELEAMAKLVYEYWFVQFDFPFDGAQGRPDVTLNGVEGYKSSGGKMVWNEELKREIPEGWVSCKLGDIIKKTGTGLNPRDNFKLGEGNNYYVTIKNIEQGKILLDEKCDKISDEALMIIDKRSDLQAGDILYTSIEPVGTTYLIKEKPTNWNINESVFTIRPDLSKVSSEFLYMFLSGDYIKAYTRNVSAGSIHKGVRHSTLKDCSLVLPDYKTIARFSKIVSPILDKQNEITKQNQELSSLRDWLLPMLMNGQVRVE